MTINFDGDDVASNYAIFLFRAESVRQQVVLKWIEDDNYTNAIIDRIINSIELKSDEQVEAKENKNAN